MDKLLYVLPALACPIGMGLMMFTMMKPKRNQAPASNAAPDSQAELAILREQVADLREKVRRTDGLPVRDTAETGDPR